MIRTPDVDILVEKVYVLLEKAGIWVPNEELAEMCRRRGCRSGADRRVRIPRELIREMVEFQQRTQAAYERDHELVYTCGPDWAHHLMWTRQADAFRAAYAARFQMQAFDCGPTTYYDYRRETVRPVDGEIFAEMLRFAEATPEIGYISTAGTARTSRRVIERLQSLVEGLKITGKLDGIEAIEPQMIKYLQEASAIVYGDARPRLPGRFGVHDHAPDAGGAFGGRTSWSASAAGSTATTWPACRPWG